MQLALDSEYGLCVGVFTKDMARALRFAATISAGIVNINAGSTYWEIHLPFGGGSGTKSARAAGRPADPGSDDRDQNDHDQPSGLNLRLLTERGFAMSQATLETTPDPGETGLTPKAAADLLAGFVDVLLPGDSSWPSGRTVGVQSLLVLRLLQQRGKKDFSRVGDVILASGGPFEGLDEAARIAVVQRFEASDPVLFGWLRDAAYVTYYENPFVAEVINAKGHIYELRPHLKGYPVPRFDTQRNTPRHGRGRFTPTDAVRRVDTSALDLTGDITHAWGLHR